MPEPKESGQNQEENSPQPETEKEHDRMTFRSLRVDDCNQILKIRNEIVLEGVPFGNRKEKTKEEFLPELEKSTELEKIGEVISIAAELDGELVGWIAGHVVRERTEVPTASGDVLMVAKKAQGRKISSKLHERWIEKARSQWGVKKVITATQVENEKSREVHKRRGYKETGFFKKDGIERVRMEMMLDAE